MLTEFTDIFYFSAYCRQVVVVHKHRLKCGRLFLFLFRLLLSSVELSLAVGEAEAVAGTDTVVMSDKEIIGTECTQEIGARRDKEGHQQKSGQGGGKRYLGQLTLSLWLLHYVQLS